MAWAAVAAAGVGLVGGAILSNNSCSSANGCPIFAFICFSLRSLERRDSSSSLCIFDKLLRAFTIRDAMPVESDSAIVPSFNHSVRLW